MADHLEDTNTGHNTGHDTDKKIKVPVVPEVERTTTEKFAVDKSEIEADIDIGDFVDIRIRGELVEIRDGGTKYVFRKTGSVKVEGEVTTSTVEEMRNRLPKSNK